MRKIVLISHRDTDTRFFEPIADELGDPLIQATSRDIVRNLMTTYPDSIVLWNAENLAAYERISEILPKYVRPLRLVAITTRPLQEYPDLFRYQIFNHHILRRYHEPANEVVADLLNMVRAVKEPSVANFFPKDTVVKTLTLKRSSQKRAAVDAIEKVLHARGAVPRLASLAAQAADELLLNGIFDAPVSVSGKRTHWNRPRNEDFSLEGRNEVTLDLASSEKLAAFSVTDQFGSLRRSTLIEALGKHYLRQKTRQASDTDPGLGVRGIYEANISLIFFTRPGKMSRTIAIFRNAELFRDFRSSFRLWFSFVP